MLTAFMVLAFAASMLGGFVPAVEGFLERLGLERILSFRSGILIAVALSDVLPEAWQQARLPAAAAALAALALGWFLHRGHGGDHEGHELTHPHVHAGAQPWTTVAALYVHSTIDGLNLGATAAVGGPAILAVGAATTLHKLADGFTLTSLFHEAGRPRAGVLVLLIGVSLATPFCAALGRAGTVSLGPWLAAVLLGFAGGSFLFVGAQQIVPHLSRERDAGCALAFGAGAAAMLALRRLGGF
ncbi:MAG TPA: ZIP family metal transporter [Elusimicrobiota bacterium]|nr:ZIP family metal transporter [Elusimicrobiota bacterium]